MIKLDNNLIDGIVSGHTHSVIHHWINDIPVIQGGVNMKYFNLIKF